LDAAASQPTPAITQQQPAAHASKKPFTSTEMRLIKQEKARVLKKKKIREVVGKLFSQAAETLPEIVEEIPQPDATKRKKKTKKDKKDVSDAQPAEPVEVSPFKIPYTDSEIDNLVTSILAISPKGQTYLHAMDEHDELLSLLKNKRKTRTNNTSNEPTPSSYQFSEVNFTQYTKPVDSSIETTILDESDTFTATIPKTLEQEDDDILSYLNELKQRNSQKQAAEPEDVEEKLSEEVWQEVASKPERETSAEEKKLAQPQQAKPKRDAASDDVVLQFLKDLIK